MTIFNFNKIYLYVLAGSSIKMIHKLARKYFIEAAKQMSHWKWINSMKDLMQDVIPQVIPGSIQDEEVQSICNMSSISQRSPSFNSLKNSLDNNVPVSDPEVAFLTTILPDLQSLDQKSKSFFKLQVAQLIHSLKYGF